jgi:hypothetical protein
MTVIVTFEDVGGKTRYTALVRHARPNARALLPDWLASHGQRAQRLGGVCGAARCV